MKIIVATDNLFLSLIDLDKSGKLLNFNYYGIFNDNICNFKIIIKNQYY